MRQFLIEQGCRDSTIAMKLDLKHTNYTRCTQDAHKMHTRCKLYHVLSFGMHTQPYARLRTSHEDVEGCMDKPKDLR